VRGVQSDPGARVSSAPENKALVCRWLEDVFTGGVFSRLHEIFTQTYVLHDPSFSEEVHGLGGIQRYVGAYRAAFPDLRVSVKDQVAEADTVATRWTARGTHRGEFLGMAPTGDEVAVSGIEFDRIVGGRIDEAWVGYHPFAGPAADPERLAGGLSALRAAFPDLSVAEVEGVREGEKAAFRWVMGGTHRGEFLGMAPTGKRVEAMGMDIVHTAGGEIVEHWGEFDAVGLLRRLGAI
jgi:predicted ester cyclase